MVTALLRRAWPVAKKKVVHDLKLGDRVKILHSGYPPARIVELRGPLGPGGAEVYRVRVRLTRKPIYIELLADQLEPIPAET